MLGRSDMMEVLRIGPMCVADWVAEWFETEIVRAAVAAPAVMHDFTGPWSPGTNLNLILAETQGPWPSREACRPGGGPGKGGHRQRSRDPHDARVTRLNLQDGAVSGVALANGEVLDGNQVAAACDPKHLFLKLIPAHLLTMEFERNVQHFRTRGTTAKINLALDDYPEFPGRPDLQAVFMRTGTTLDDLERPSIRSSTASLPWSPCWTSTCRRWSHPSWHPQAITCSPFRPTGSPTSLKGAGPTRPRTDLLESVVDTLEGYFPRIRQSIVGSRC